MFNGLNRNFLKAFMDNEGDLIELDDYGNEAKGYGVGYSHPQNLNNNYGYKIKCFKDMDLALDELEFLRVLIDSDFRSFNIGNKITSKQLLILQNEFNNYENVRVKINSISKKWYKSFIDFKNALSEHETEIEDNTQEFKSHIEALSC